MVENKRGPRVIVYPPVFVFIIFGARFSVHRDYSHRMSFSLFLGTVRKVGDEITCMHV